MIIIKKIIFFLGIVFLSISILALALFLVIKHYKIDKLIAYELQQELGVKVTIEEVVVSPLVNHLSARGITVYNPAGFEEEELAYISSIDIAFDLIDVIRRVKPNVYLFIMDLERLNVIKNKKGQVNIEQLHPFGKIRPEEDTAPFYFDVMLLSVNEVYYIDYSESNKKTSKYVIGMEDQVFLKVIDEDDLIRLIVYKAIQNTNIGKMVHLRIIPVISGVSETVSSAWGTAQTGLKSLSEIATLPFKLLFVH